MGKDKSNSITEVALELQLSVAEGKNQKLEEEKAALQSQVETLRKTIEGQRDCIGDLVSEKTELEKENRNLQTKIDEANGNTVDISYYSRLSEDYESLASQQKNLKQKNAAVTSEKNYLKGVNNTLVAQQKELEEKNKALTVEKNYLRGENKNLNSQNDQLKEENKTLTERLRVLENRKAPRWPIAIVALLALLVGAGVAFSTSFTLEKWWQWEHIIGALGGAILFVPLLIWAWSQQNDDGIWGVFCFSGLFFSAWVWLVEFFGAKISIIVYWLSGWTILTFILTGILCIKQKDLECFLIDAIGLLVGTLGLAMVSVWNYQGVSGHLYGAWSGVLCLYWIVVLSQVVTGWGGIVMIGIEIATMLYISIKVPNATIYCLWFFAITMIGVLWLFIGSLKKKERVLTIISGIEMVATVVSIVLTVSLFGA